MMPPFLNDKLVEPDVEFREIEVAEIKVAVELSMVCSLSSRSVARSRSPWVVGVCARVAEISGEIEAAVEMSKLYSLSTKSAVRSRPP